MNKSNIKKILPYASAIIIFIVITLIYLSPLLEGQRLRQSDIIQHKGMSKEIVDYREKAGIDPLWTNSMFGGMPAYQISVKYKGNLVRFIDDILQLGLPHPAGLIFLYLLGFFILLIVLKVDPWLSIGGAIAFGFSSYFFIIFEAGHNSKAHAIGYMAPVLAGIIMTYRGKYILGGILTLLFLALEINAGHPQITYYLFLLLLVFGIAEFAGAVKSKSLPGFIKSSVIVLAAGLIAVLTHITSLWATYEYGKETIRGKSELSTNQENRTSGIDKDYATQWSYGISESLSLLVPNIKGGATGRIGDKEYALKNVDSQLKETVANNANHYWGDQPFTSGPVYAGAIIIFLFIYGLFIVKGNMKWWLLAGTILSLMLAWGKNFMPLTDLFMNYFPGYNKFRAVSMTMVIAELTIPILAMIALNTVLTEQSVLKKKISFYKTQVNPFYLSFGITAGLVLLFALIPDIFFRFLSQEEIAGIAQQKKSNPEYASQITDFYYNVEIARKAILRADAFRSFVFILLAGIVIWAFSINKLKKGWVIGLLSVLILIDMWAVNKRYLNNENFVSKSKSEKPFQKSRADELILKDSDPNFRVLNLTVDPFADASTSYFHKSIGGYHGAKLRRYQELYDHHMKGKLNMDVLNMLNTKYIIQADDKKQPSVYPNMKALGNAWFVTEIKMVKNANEEIDALTDFNPETTAVIDERFSKYINGFTPSFDSTALIKLIKYAPNNLQYQVNTNKDQLAVFSEIYYDKGWNAYVDGTLTPHFRVNYVLRGMVIPQGKHLVEFKFEPRVFRVGEKISLASSLLLIFLVIGGFSLEIKKVLKSLPDKS